ncbi:M23 family metallopeptidase [Paenibacillus sp. sptzw28]|uniref:M23 family metallopeptidase n=1 Tax=Paenibacillus sp. sptzw28 TaxID=715179 RepID=UPI001C6E0B0E|nr:M23 family metallopeptidase [Paenibacillus sp. sptzw28]QYR23383.1 M23 family metallopeptidase [Paenibacillus sp. sptzw28]
MDTKSGNRQRRQERIRRIMEQNQATIMPVPRKGHSVNHLQPPPSLHAPSSVPAGGEAYRADTDFAASPLERDPERLWKSQTNPWDNSGWRIANNLNSKKMNPQRGQDGSGGRNTSYIVRGLFIQTAIAAALFAIIFAMFKVNTPIAKKGQQIVTAALTEKMDFDRAASWYNRMFAGAPSFIPLFGGGDDEQAKLAGGSVDLPVMSPIDKGSVVRSFAETLSGVEIAGESGESVLAAETGRVQLVTDDKNTGKTVVVQHANERVTVYGNLGEAQVSANDWVEAGQLLGKLQTAKEGEQSLLFFAVKEKGRYVDPADVIPFD